MRELVIRLTLSKMGIAHQLGNNNAEHTCTVSMFYFLRRSYLTSRCTCTAARPAWINTEPDICTALFSVCAVTSFQTSEHLSKRYVLFYSSLLGALCLMRPRLLRQTPFTDLSWNIYSLGCLSYMFPDDPALTHTHVHGRRVVHGKKTNRAESCKGMKIWKIATVYLENVSWINKDKFTM